VESTGQASAEAKARAEAAKIEGEANVTQSKHRAEAQQTKDGARLKMLLVEHAVEIEYKTSWNELEIKKAQLLSDVESKKFKAIVDAVGAETLKKISQAGPEMQARLLSGLGLKSFMITDGNKPISLFSTATGLISPGNQL